MDDVAVRVERPERRKGLPLVAEVGVGVVLEDRFEVGPYRCRNRKWAISPAGSGRSG